MLMRDFSFTAKCVRNTLNQASKQCKVLLMYACVLQKLVVIKSKENGFFKQFDKKQHSQYNVTHI